MNKTESKAVIGNLSAEQQAAVDRCVTAMVAVGSAASMVATAIEQVFAVRLSGHKAWQAVEAGMKVSGASVDPSTRSWAKRIILSGQTKRPTDPKSGKPLALKAWAANCPALSSAKVAGAAERLNAARGAKLAGPNVTTVIDGKVVGTPPANQPTFTLDDCDAADAVTILLAELGPRPTGKSAAAKAASAAYDAARRAIDSLADYFHVQADGEDEAVA